MNAALRRGSAAAALALALALAAPAGAARAGVAAVTPVPPVPPRTIPGTPVPEGALPFYFTVPPPSDSRHARPSPPLDPAVARSVRRAIDLRLAGLPERALDTLRVAERAAPHHPVVVVEMARAHMAREDFGASWSLLRTERAAAHDSLLGSPELELSAERLGRPRDAALAAVETWVASAPEGQWALAALLRVLPQDARAAVEPLRAAVARQPARGDLARGLALLLARLQRPEEAARVLATADRPAWRPPLRQQFADEALFSALATDSAAATEALLSLAGDTAFAPVLRLSAARRALQLSTARGLAPETAPRIARALEGVPAGLWGEDLLLSLARTLREAGHGAEARALLVRAGELLRGRPELVLERAWSQLREGPPATAVPLLDSLARAWPPAWFALAEAEFFAGRSDSALAHYRLAARDPDSPNAVPALERTYLIEERPGDPVLQALGELAYERWRGNGASARRIADSLWRSLPPSSPFHAHAALQAAELRAEIQDWSGALPPLLAVADSLPGDRLAPLARQRAGEALLAMGNPRGALQQFEECLARYPRAWNAPEVRRQVERLRRESRL
jgi:tetratricopeptide (TPR) repeat protein